MSTSIWPCLKGLCLFQERPLVCIHRLWLFRYQTALFSLYKNLQRIQQQIIIINVVWLQQPSSVASRLSKQRLLSLLKLMFSKQQKFSAQTYLQPPSKTLWQVTYQIKEMQTVVIKDCDFQTRYIPKLAQLKRIRILACSSIQCSVKKPARFQNASFQ